MRQETPLNFCRPLWCTSCSRLGYFLKSKQSKFSNEAGQPSDIVEGPGWVLDKSQRYECLIAQQEFHLNCFYEQGISLCNQDLWIYPLRYIHYEEACVCLTWSIRDEIKAHWKHLRWVTLQMWCFFDMISLKSVTDVIRNNVSKMWGSMWMFNMKHWACDKS